MKIEQLLDSREPISIEKARFIYVDASGNTPQFTVFKDDMYIRVDLRERDKDHLQDLYDEMNHVASFNHYDLVDLVISRCRWEVGRNSGTTYFLVSIKRSDNG
jgi:hypothetical protein